jgi:cyclopropane fatty-acyl-phospholipid synthase-like methyltransferase
VAKEKQMKDKRNPGAIDYFDRRIDNFDSIYDTNRTGLMAWLDKKLRSSVRERFTLAFDLLGDLSGKSVLDIGCGTGRYMFEAVKRGASDVVGLDAASGALDAARKMADDLGMQEKVAFFQTDFMDYKPEKKFDIIFAVGYFDYILSPLPHLTKMLDISGGFLYASFPKLWHPMTPVRKTRLAFNGCPVRFYSHGRLNSLAEQAGVKNIDIRFVSRDFVLIAKK